MGERNDLIDPNMSNQQMRLHFGEMKAQEMRTARAAIRFANSRAATIIASLSEALAEAEKKGAEDEGALAKAIFQADYPTDKWERFARGDVVDERYRLLARAALARIFPPRDLSQGGQHG